MDIKKIEKILGIKVMQEKLFEEAFTHRSYLNEHEEKELSSNERLEFLGDAVLQFLSSKFLFQKYKDIPEGDLTNIRAALVRTESLAEESKRLNFGEFLLLSRGEENSNGREREYILANTFEAVLGAIYLNKENIEICEKYLARNLFYKTEKIVENKEFKDFKSSYQEYTQEKFGVTPIYKVIDEWGPDHSKNFKVGVYLGEELKGEGVGGSKQEAEHEAAKSASSML
ncbi:ribonuclease III [candidate division WWE3 bacterium CG08_land_8_20_14_0_20_41_15]|uniref:Ribonuclease 3 n=1 Tax=candidate division WWE3 bacterium CG08_land_8_20_14_0_20_41_15 TaxID=1975086 RepID=A0A2H0XB67_UNCKA|nr:MAG: ribonuclease III [candidate division WWE3 bacterium CG08_land_8_20_14_0_20_41_15]